MSQRLVPQEGNVLDDLDDLEESFGYYRPIMEEDEEAQADGTAPRKRGRPPKDPSEAMSAVQKADRLANIKAAYWRLRTKSS